MISLRRAWLLASMVLFWQGCSLNDSGLTSDGGPGNDAGTGGVRSDGPVAGSGGSAAGGRGGSPTGVAGSAAGAGGSAGGNVAGAGGSVAGTGGSVAGAGGSIAGAAGSVAGAAGSVAGMAGTVGGAGAGGSVAGAGGQGMAGAGGTVGGAGGISGMGGSVAGMGGSVAGTGGRGGAGMSGRGGSGGRGGAGGRACVGYPANARSFVPPGESRAHCYWSHGNMQTFSQARSTCSNEDGHLVTILSEEENLFVVSIAQFSPMYSDTWIGATDGRTGSNNNGPGTYSWVTGETWNFDAWNGEEPDGACDTPCSGLGCSCDHRGTLVSDGTWSDRYEGTSRGFVCESTP